jgi:hypothetical protein
MSKLWPVLVMIGIIVANLPAMMEQWRTDRAGFIKTVELFLVYLVYCLIGGGLIIWLASRAHENHAGAWTIVALTAGIVGWIFYGALTLARAVPRYRELPNWAARFGLADIALLAMTFACLAAAAWA